MRTVRGVRLDSLTGLRFFAAAMVVAYHLVFLFHQSGWLVTATGPGFIGVGFFFTLSGLVLTWSANGASAGLFYWRRFARVWPTHAATWLAALVLFGVTAGLTSTLVLVQSWSQRIDVNFGMNGVSWSLACEAFFYLLFPLLLTWLRRVRSLLKVGVVVAVLMVEVGTWVYLTQPPYKAFWFLYVCPAYRLGEFLLGMIVGVALTRGWRLRLPITAGALVLLTGVATVAVAHPVRAGNYITPNNWLYDVAALPGFLLILAAAASRDLEGKLSFCSRRLVVISGEWSFCLYMTHQLVMRQAAHLPVPWLVSLLAVLPVAGLLHRGWERPVERLLRSLPEVLQREVQRRVAVRADALPRPVGADL